MEHVLLYLTFLKLIFLKLLILWKQKKSVCVFCFGYIYNFCAKINASRSKKKDRRSNLIFQGFNQLNLIYDNIRQNKLELVFFFPSKLDLFVYINIVYKSSPIWEIEHPNWSPKTYSTKRLPNIFFNNECSKGGNNKFVENNESNGKK